MKKLRIIPLHAFFCVGLLFSTYADDIDLTADIRAVYAADPASVIYSDSGHHDETGLTAYTPFDGLTTARWLSANGHETAYVQIELSTAYKGGLYPVVKHCKLYGNAANRRPTELFLLGSNDGVNWVTNAIITGGLTWTANVAEFTVEHPRACRYNRLYMTKFAAVQSTYRYDLEEVYFYGTYDQPNVAVCPGIHADGAPDCTFVTTTEYFTDTHTFVPAPDFTIGATSYACTGYTLETSVDGGETWTSRTSDEKSVTLARSDTLYRLTWLWAVTRQGGTTYYVSPEGDDSDGLTWATAFKSPAGHDFNTQADTVLIAGGTYDLTGATVALNGAKDVLIRGGYDPATGKCDPLAHPTVFTTQASNAGVALTIANSAGVTVENIAFDSCVNSVSSGSAIGSAVVITDSTTVHFSFCKVRNCLTDCTTPNGSSPNALGVIRITGSTGLVFAKVDFESNRAQNRPSGGVDKSDISNPAHGAVSIEDSETTFEKCKFVGNKSTSLAPGALGGAVRAGITTKNQANRTTFRGCIFAANCNYSRVTQTYPVGDGVQLVAPGRPNQPIYFYGNTGTGSAISGFNIHATDCLFAGNQGCAIRWESASSSMGDLSALRNCTFFNQRQDYDAANFSVLSLSTQDCRHVESLDISKCFEGKGIWVSTAGDDAAAGTEAAPLRTLTAALAKADHGDTVHVVAGTYGAGESFPLTLRGKAGVSLVAEGEVFVDAGKSANARVLNLIDCDQTSIRGFRMTGGNVFDTKGYGGGVLVLGCSDTLLEDVSIYGNTATTPSAQAEEFAGGGMLVTGGNIVMRDVEFRGNTLGTDGYALNSYGLGLALWGAALDADRCRFSGNVGYGSYTSSHRTFGGGAYFGNHPLSGDKVLVRNSVVDGNRIGKGYYSNSVRDRAVGLGLCVEGVSSLVNCTALTNSVVDTEKPLDCAGVFGSAIVATNCLSFGHAVDFSSEVTGAGNAYGAVASASEGFGIAIEDPKLKAGTFRPDKGSPLVDAGLDVGLTKKDLDFYSARRVCGAAIDIGAGELQTGGGLMLLVR